MVHQRCQANSASHEGQSRHWIIGGGSRHGIARCLANASVSRWPGMAGAVFGSCRKSGRTRLAWTGWSSSSPERTTARHNRVGPRRVRQRTNWGNPLPEGTPIKTISPETVVSGNEHNCLSKACRSRHEEVCPYNIAQPLRRPIHQLPGPCESRINQQHFCPVCNRDVNYDQLVKKN